MLTEEGGGFGAVAQAETGEIKPAVITQVGGDVAAQLPAFEVAARFAEGAPSIRTLAVSLTEEPLLQSGMVDPFA